MTPGFPPREKGHLLFPGFVVLVTIFLVVIVTCILWSRKKQKKRESVCVSRLSCSSTSLLALHSNPGAIPKGKPCPWSPISFSDAQVLSCSHSIDLSMVEKTLLWCPRGPSVSLPLPTEFLVLWLNWKYIFGDSR